MGAFYQKDVAFPEYAYFWSTSTAEEDIPGKEGKVSTAEGGYVHIFLKNNDSKPVALDDLLFEGTSLKRAIAFSQKRKFKKVAHAANLYFSDLPQADRDRLISLGEPVWWKAEPASIAPNAVGEIVIRLRRTPKVQSLKIGIPTSEGAVQVDVPMNKTFARVEGIFFGEGLSQAFVYLRHPDKGKSPVKILMDGADITSSCKIGADPRSEVIPVVCTLSAPVERASFHCFEAVYPDGVRAMGGVRAFADEMVYGLWGARPGKESDIELARSYIREIAQHSINVQMEMIASDAVRAFMNTDEGIQLMKSLGIRRVVGEPEKARGLAAAYYLADEPDTADYKLEGVPWTSKVGSLAQGLIQRAEEVRAVDRLTPTMLNVDMTFKPENWYTYGQLPDIYAADPYYQTRLCQAYWSKPETIPHYSKATFVYAVGRVCQSACSPKPLHLILNCTRVQKDGRKFRFGTPQEKRIEVYYALAAGAKGLSYWWFVPIGDRETGSCGCSVDEPEAKALWREIGLLGAEVRTAGPIIMKSCPAPLPTTATEKLWVRSLLSGLDTLVVLCVNDDYTNDQKGTTIRPVENASVGVTLPSWLDAKEAFEVSARGISDVDWKKTGPEVSLNLGRVDVTRMVVITSDPTLRDRIQTLFASRFSANASSLYGK